MAEFLDFIAGLTVIFIIVTIFCGICKLVFTKFLSEIKTVFKIKESIICGKSTFHPFSVTYYNIGPSIKCHNHSEFNTLEEAKEYIENYKCKQNKDVKIHEL